MENCHKNKVEELDVVYAGLGVTVSSIIRIALKRRTPGSTVNRDNLYSALASATKGLLSQVLSSRGSSAGLSAPGRRTQSLSSEYTAGRLTHKALAAVCGVSLASVLIQQCCRTLFKFVFDVYMMCTNMPYNTCFLLAHIHNAHTHARIAHY